MRDVVVTGWKDCGSETPCESAVVFQPDGADATCSSCGSSCHVAPGFQLVDVAGWPWCASCASVRAPQLAALVILGRWNLDRVDDLRRVADLLCGAA